MRILLLILIMMAIFAITARASVVRRDVDDFGDDEDSAENAIDEDNNGDDDDDDPEDLPIASIKSRAIAMDRDLCRELSRYHPHHPRCQLYCEKLNHWMGMCRRDSCHCYS
ncbi:uncharacterized protein LOC135958018 [Calliphora vicina]|uniref:uncharacterized protein LOC135958018 n=1 Tax=Calliphora vicina TaxID=7373 RepID=UPI00325A8950